MRLLIGVSGGVAAYKAIETARLAVRAGHSVRVIQTPTSERFVGRASFAAITGAPVLISEFEADPARGSYPGEPVPEHAPISHLELVRRADVYLIAPASANTISKLAVGAADNLVTTAALAADCPVAVAPAMNNRMYRNAATQANVKTLRDRGMIVIPPGEGELASRGERGVGRLAEPAELLAACVALSGTNGGPLAGGTRASGTAAQTLGGLTVLVTAGGTQEPIDSVRFVGNRSSGRMGYALAAEALRRGARVTIVSANVKLDAPQGAQVIAVGTAAELADATYAQAADADIVLMAAAVADFRPVAPVADKIKKTASDAPTRIELEATEDVLDRLASERRAGQLLIGFAAEHGQSAAENGREKLDRKRLDAIVVNDISRPEIGFDSEENEVLILTAAGGSHAVGQRSKAEVAAVILDEVQRLREVSAALLN